MLVVIKEIRRDIELAAECEGGGGDGSDAATMT